MARIALIVGGILASLAGMLWFADRLVETPAVVLLAAIVPTLGWTVLVAAFGRVRPTLVAALLFWGAVIAACAAQALGDRGMLGPLGSGPLVEELLKATGLVVLARVHGEVLRDARSGATSGALVGVGFGFAENLVYLLLAAVQGGSAGLVRGVYLRGLLGGPTHAVFTAAAGAGLGWAREHIAPRDRILATAAGLGAALLQHVTWNAVAATTLTDVMCNPIEAGGACAAAPSAFGLFVVAPAVTVAVLGPGVVALLVLVRGRGVSLVPRPRAGYRE